MKSPHLVLVTNKAKALKFTMALICAQISVIGSVEAQEIVPSPTPKVVSTYKKASGEEASLTVDMLTSMASTKKGGTNGGGAGGNRVDLVTGWCRGSTEILADVRDTNAKMAIFRSNFGLAKVALKEGLVEALMKEKAEGAERSLSFQAMSRILVIADAIETQAQISYPSRREVCKCSTPTGNITSEVQAVIDEDVTDFLMKAYDFLIDVSGKVDMIHYIPYVFRGPNQLSGVEQATFERAYAEYAKKQIDWIVNQFTGDSGLTGAIVPLMGRQDKMYLRALSLILKFVSDDLRSSLFNTSYACAIEKADRMSAALDAHLSGDDTKYGGSDMYAVQMTWPKLNEISNSLAYACGTLPQDKNKK